MNRKGQALVEFVLILPVLIMILFAIVDFGNVFYSRYQLQNKSSDIVRLVQSDKDIKEIINIYDDYDIDVSLYKNDYQKITISKNLNFITPGINKIFGDPYLIEVERIIPND